jgi:pyruvate/oxaloacetate carboxyltransferase
MTRQSAQRWLKTGVDKLERFDVDGLSDFRAIDKEARRPKYDEADIHALRTWMVNNRETLDTPKEKDSICARDMYGASNPDYMNAYTDST